MNTASKSAQGLTIGELASRTGLSPATLRVWEQRHGFPVPRRVASGHRRYRAQDVLAVRQVLAHRDSGVRLDVAIARVRAGRSAAEESATSVYAELRRRHPHLAPARLRKSTLLGLSWAIEDEFCARAERPYLFGGFQRREFYEPARARWQELARVARSAFVLADFPAPSDGQGPTLVPLAEDAPMRAEWVVVCDALELPAVLAAWEVPGQEGVPDRDRLFDALWSVEAAPVRDAARVCARTAQTGGSELAGQLLFELADDPAPGAVDLRTVTTLFNRVVAYVDAATAR